LLFLRMENASFFNDVLRNWKIPVTAVIQKSYLAPWMGAGGSDQGAWLPSQFKELNTEYYFVSERHLRELNTHPQRYYDLEEAFPDLIPSKHGYMHSEEVARISKDKWPSCCEGGTIVLKLRHTRLQP